MHRSITYFDLYLQFLEKFQPDVVMNLLTYVFSAYLRMEARARGIPVVYALRNGLILLMLLCTVI